MKRFLFLSVILSSLLTACAPEPSTGVPSFDEVVTTRRSIRNYDASKTILAPEWANDGLHADIKGKMLIGEIIGMHKDLFVH